MMSRIQLNLSLKITHLAFATIFVKVAGTSLLIALQTSIIVDHHVGDRHRMNAMNVRGK